LLIDEFPGFPLLAFVLDFGTVFDPLTCARVTITLFGIMYIVFINDNWLLC